MNLIVGTSKTVHNASAQTIRNIESAPLPADGEKRVEGTHWEWIAVPTCSVAFDGKTMTQTDAAITCKTCAKRA